MSPPITVPFVKASACGNDFLIVDAIHAPRDTAGFCRRICNRHLGIGADGVEWLSAANDADIGAKLYNADGSEAEISGNGTRCVAAYLYAEREKEKLVIKTDAGLKTCTLTSVSENLYEFEIGMGEPQLEERLSVHTPLVGAVEGIPVSMGNPHFVVFTDKVNPEWQKQAADIGKSGHFKNGVNVEIVVVQDRKNIDVLFSERGVGETQSSGTGSCAAAVASIASGLAASPLRVHTAGGVQTVRWDKEVFLRGVAQLVCRGEYFV